MYILYTSVRFKILGVVRSIQVTLIIHDWRTTGTYIYTTACQSLISIPISGWLAISMLMQSISCVIPNLVIANTQEPPLHWIFSKYYHINYNNDNNYNNNNNNTDNVIIIMILLPLLLLVLLLLQLSTITTPTITITIITITIAIALAITIIITITMINRLRIKNEKKLENSSSSRYT